MKSGLRQTLTTGVAALVFSLSGAAQTFPPTSTIYTFSGPPGDGANPQAALVIGGGGVLYGTTSGGGILLLTCTGDPNFFGVAGCGTVFSVTPPASPGGAWTEAVLHQFTGSDGANPYAPVIIGNGGVHYGTTYYGGSGNLGVVYSLTPPSFPGGTWTEAVLHSFIGGSDGANPYAPVIGLGGVLYGTTEYGGIAGDGMVFSLTPPACSEPGAAWKETVLHSFSGSDGADPQGALVSDASGTLYGTTMGGGALGLGTVSSLAPPASAHGPWTLAVLHSFTGSDGATPEGGLAVHGGVLYGTTSGGGASGLGTVFSLSPPTSRGGPWIETVLHSFSGGHDGSIPEAGVAIDPSGVLFGTTDYGGFDGLPGQAFYGYGTLFSVTPPASAGGAWTHQTITGFYPNLQFHPIAPVVIGAQGLVYGTAYGGITADQFWGTVFSVTTH